MTPSVYILISVHRHQQQYHVVSQFFSFSSFSLFFVFLSFYHMRTLLLLVFLWLPFFSVCNSTKISLGQLLELEYSTLSFLPQNETLPEGTEGEKKMSTQEKESTLTRLAEFHYTTEQNIRAWYSHGGDIGILLPALVPTL